MARALARGWGEPVLCSDAGSGRAGALVLSKGPEGAPIEFLSFATGAVKTIFTTTKPVYIGLAASPDGRSLLFTQVDRAESDLWMVENFR